MNQEGTRIRRGAEMSDKADDYWQRWSNFLSYGGHHFCKELLTPDTAFIISPDGSKISVIGAGKNDSPYQEYDEEQQVVYVDLQYVQRHSPMGFSFSLLNCPSCGKSYTVSFKDCLDDEIISMSSGIIYMNRDNYPYFNCACGLTFFFNDKYEYLSLPFSIKELEPLYQMGMSRTADLLLRYVLSFDRRSLLEDIGAIARMPYQASLTDNPLRVFDWTIPPCFTSECNGGLEGVHDVQIWRRRIYVLDCNRFAESTWHHYGHWGKTVIRYHRFMGNNVWSVFTPPDELLNSAELLELIIRGNKLPSRGRGGRRNVKVADLSEPVRKALGRRYKELGDTLTNVKKDAKAAFKVLGESGWRDHILKGYPILKNHSDLIEKINPYDIPSDREGSGEKAPWEIAIEIAARDVILDYEKNSASSDALKKAAILPSEEK
jgi:hypothetical protein